MIQLPIEQAFQVAVQHHQAGRLPQAEALYRQILAQQPKHAQTIQLLGVIAFQSGQAAAAVELMRQAIALHPDYAEAFNNLSAALMQLGQVAEAETAARKGIALWAGYAEAYLNLGHALRAQGRVQEAIAEYRQAVALGPNGAKFCSALGNTLREAGQMSEAVAVLRRAVALQGNSVDAWVDLGNALKWNGQRDEAGAAYQRATALDPRCALAYNNLGTVLKDQGKLDEAIELFGRAIALDAGRADAMNNLGIVRMDLGEVEEAIAAFRQAVAVQPGFAEAYSNLLYNMQFHPHADAAAIAADHRRWNQQYALPLKQFIQPYANERDPERRLRIGYISPDLREHPVGRFVLPLLKHHDKRQVEVFAYSQAAAPDAFTARAQASADGWRDIVRMTDAQVAEMIRADRIDILVDLTMHMGYNRLLMLARKPAPVQVTYLAYCASTGLETIDYRLSDPYLDPPGMDETIYSERTVRLPETYWCYEPSVAATESGPLPAAGRGQVTFGCLNNFCKVSAAALGAWGRLLREVPGSRLLLHAYGGSHRGRVLERLKREGIAAERVDFAEFLPAEKYFELHRQIDIALDTFPYGGGTTTCDALWMGVPVVSLAGERAVGRGGLSILSNIGLPELVGRTEEEYVRIGAGLAGDLRRLAELRGTLRGRMEKSPLMDAARFARNVEAAYRQMWRAWCAKK